MSATLLVTGADGFTGRHFIAVAESRGWQVHGLRANLVDANGVSDEVAQVQPDAVLHLAGISHVGHADARAFYDVNLVGSLNLLQALAKLPRVPRQVLLASSANVYGNCPQSPISEEQPPAPTNHYAVSKLAMEHMSRNFSEALPIILARPFNYTGPGQAVSFVIPKLVDHFARKAPMIELGRVDVEREFNDVRFLCEAYLQLLDKGEAGQIYNVCSGNPVTLQSVIDLLIQVTGHKMEVRLNNAFVRSHEVYRLCGDPARLESVAGPLNQFPLEATLRWMLAAAAT